MDAAVRQQLLKRMDGFDGSVAALRRLVNDLDGVWSLETWDEADRRRFRGEWGKLEETYATAIERTPPALNPVDLERVHEALAGLRESLPA
jgi:hypothetical protein